MDRLTRETAEEATAYLARVHRMPVDEARKFVLRYLTADPEPYLPFPS